MATIVEDIETRYRYVLIGTGFGAFHAVTPGVILGNLAPTRETGEYTMVCVCDARGTMGWLYSDKARIVSVDGQDPAAVLGH